MMAQANYIRSHMQISIHLIWDYISTYSNISLSFLDFWNSWANTGLCSSSCGMSGNLLQERSYMTNGAIFQQSQNFSSSCNPGVPCG